MVEVGGIIPKGGCVMKRMLAIPLLIVNMAAVRTAARQEKTEATILGSSFLPVTDGQGAIRINSFGNAGFDPSRLGFSIGGVGHLAEFNNYVSINNGRVEITGESGLGWSVVSPLAIDGGTATSTVQRQDALQIRFTQTVRDNGGGLVDWFVSAQFTNLSGAELDVCYFPYLDYDLFGTELNDTATYSAVDDDFVRPAVRVRKLGREEVFVFVDLDGSSTEWRIRQWTSDSFSGEGCITLDDMVTPFGPGDFTSAYKFPLALAPGETVAIDLQLGRFQ